MKRILYIKRDHSNEPWKKRLISIIRGFVFFIGQDGYFEEALYSQFKIKEISVKKFLRLSGNKIEESFDAVAVNYKTDHFSISHTREDALTQIAKRVDLPTILFIDLDRAAHLPPNEVLDQYDVIVKREIFKDRDRYDISEKNKHKMYTSMLACPLVRSFRSPRRAPLKFLFAQTDVEKPLKKKYDIFFSGAISKENPVRLNVWDRIVKEGFNAYGGLQANTLNDTVPPNDLVFGKLTRQEFVDAMRQAKINFALDGIGEFTFRHLELWYLGEFMISSPSIKEVELPLPVKEDVHYVSYDDLDELVEKIRFYLKNDTEREKIAIAGKEMFDEYYDPVKHGRDILGALNNV